jgi:hypothetical protein
MTMAKCLNLQGILVFYEKDMNPARVIFLDQETFQVIAERTLSPRGMPTDLYAMNNHSSTLLRV